MMRFKPRGRVPSLLAWGLLVGGVALLMTLPGDGAPAETLRFRQLPAAILYVLAGLVFGLSHPEGRVWSWALLLGWVPMVAGMAMALDGSPPPLGPWLGVMLLPGLLAAAGARIGAALGRRRADAR